VSDDERKNQPWNASVYILALLLSFIGGTVAMEIGRHCEREEIRRDAVKAGLARYVTDEAGAQKFEWIQIKEAK
jgi:hypothetical protein